MSKAEEVFEKYAGEFLSIGGTEVSGRFQETKKWVDAIDKEDFLQALQNGDLFLKADVERKEIEAKIEAYKEFTESKSGCSTTLNKFLHNIKRLEKKLQELK